MKVCVIDTIEIPPCSEAILPGSVFGLPGEVLVELKYLVKIRYYSSKKWNILLAY